MSECDECEECYRLQNKIDELQWRLETYEEVPPGREAEELRQELESSAAELMSNPEDADLIIREVLDKVDARDSLRFLECPNKMSLQGFNWHHYREKLLHLQMPDQEVVVRVSSVDPKLENTAILEIVTGEVPILAEDRSWLLRIAIVLIALAGIGIPVLRGESWLPVLSGILFGALFTHLTVRLRKRNKVHR